MLVQVGNFGQVAKWDITASHPHFWPNFQAVFSVFDKHVQLEHHPLQAQDCFVERSQKPEKVLQPVSNNPVSGSSSIVAHTKERCFIHNSRALHYAGHRGPGDKECRPIASQPSKLLSIMQFGHYCLYFIHINTFQFHSMLPKHPSWISCGK